MLASFIAPGALEWLFVAFWGLIAGVVPLVLLIYLLILATRLVRAVERIANHLERT